MKITFALTMVITLPCYACGPWFPDTALDRPQAALATPPVCYEAEIASLFPATSIHPLPSGEELAARDANAEHPLCNQIPAECKELEIWWRSQNIDGDELARRLKAYRALRESQLTAIGVIDFRSVHVEGEGGAGPEHPLAGIVPVDVADSVEATRLLLAGCRMDARALWQGILARPAGEKKFRAAQAAWMLAKTSETDDEALAAYARVRAEVAAGANDVLALAPAAAGWLGPRAENPVEGLRLLVEAWKGGGSHALIDLRRLSSKLLTGDATQLAALAKDPLARQLLNIEVYTVFDRAYGNWREDDEKEQFPYTAWLVALEAEALDGPAGEDRIAWALYENGSYDQSRRWLAMADPTSPKAQWLKAKFALRDGNLAQADRALSRAVGKLCKSSDWKPSNQTSENLNWLASHELQQSIHGQLLVDTALVDVGQGEFLKAVDALVSADYWCDAAYLAESVLDTDELISYVRRTAPHWSKDLLDWWHGKMADSPAPAVVALDGSNSSTGDLLMPGQASDRLRYLLGRRLAREFRFREAREFLPEPLLPVLDRLVVLHRAAISGDYHDKELAALLWQQAVITRNAGMELYGTENAPDGYARYGGMFDGNDFLALRRHTSGWDTNWVYSEDVLPPVAPELALKPGQRAIPTVTRDEIRRATANVVRPEKRYHYRYTAAELAWKAAANLPDNHNAKVYMLNTAGKWLASRDPGAADRFYKAMVRRNPNNPLAQAADSKRWFISLDEPPDMPALPAKLQLVAVQ